MFYDPKIVKALAPVSPAVPTAAAQTGTVALQSPNGALPISIATARGRSVDAAGGQLAYRVDFRGQPGAPSSMSPRLDHSIACSGGPNAAAQPKGLGCGDAPRKRPDGSEVAVSAGRLVPVEGEGK